MCNHYKQDPALIPTWREYAGFDFRMPNEPFSEDVWPKRHGLIVRRAEGRPIADVMNWGVPTKVRGASGKMLDKRVTNVRNLASPFWRSMLAAPAQRCLVPFSSFAEPKAGAGRDEWWFTLPDQPTAAFAGIWRDTEHGRCYAFLTCDPNELVAPLHPKAMPAILTPADYDQWLTAGYDEACALARPCAASELTVA